MKALRRINPLESPLYRLPTDLFPEIPSRLTSEADLVNATHTSHHLRNTLLSHPALWSHLNFDHEMRARKFFERSGQAPLHVDMVRDTAKMVGSLAELRQQSNRIATLKLRHWSIQKRFLSEHLPSLRRLEIFYGYHDNSREKEEWHFPSLTSLIVYELKSIPVSAPNLTRFKFLSEGRLSSKHGLLGFLGGCPLLEHIDISYKFWPPLGETDLIVSLPSLRTYTETNLDGTCSPTVINTLSLPPSFQSRLGSWMTTTR